MKKPMSKKVLAAVTAAAMAMSLAACGGASSAEAPAAEPAAEEVKEEAPATEEAEAEDEEDEDEEEEASEYTILTDADGNPIDLGGIEVVIRDWWSPEEPAAPTNDYEEARDEYREWAQETYNFKIKEVAISDWGSTPQDFVDYVTTGGDDNNYVFVLRNDAAIVSAMANGLMYDLNSLDALDFSRDKFQLNKTHEMYSKGDKIYCMASGYSEPRSVMFFNKRVLTEAGIDPESIYDMQANDEWTWDAFTDIMDKCQRDTDNDGEDDVYGFTANEGQETPTFVYANNGDFIGKDASGKYTYDLEKPETQEALEWIVDMYTKYDNHDPEGAEWDYYKEDFMSGNVAFMSEGAWAGYASGYLSEMKDELGTVMVPKGPKGTMINIWDNNPIAIPGCYDKDRAEKIAKAWDIYTDDVPGYEGYNGYASNWRSGVFDTRACDETLALASSAEHGAVAYHNVIPNLKVGEEFVWSVAPGADISALTEAIADTWKAYVDEANQ